MRVYSDQIQRTANGKSSLSISKDMEINKKAASSTKETAF